MKRYVIRCEFDIPYDEFHYDYWSNEIGWTMYIELATFFKDKPTTLHFIRGAYMWNVEIVELDV